MPDVSEASASVTLDAANDETFPFLYLPQEVLFEIIDMAHEAYVAKEKHDGPHPLMNLRL